MLSVHSKGTHTTPEVAAAAPSTTQHETQKSMTPNNLGSGIKWRLVIFSNPLGRLCCGNQMLWWTAPQRPYTKCGRLPHWQNCRRSHGSHKETCCSGRKHNGCSIGTKPGKGVISLDHHLYCHLTDHWVRQRSKPQPFITLTATAHPEDWDWDTTPPPPTPWLTPV